MEVEKKQKWKWINSAFYLDEPFEKDGIQKALEDEFVKKDLLKLIHYLWQINDNN